MSEKWDARHWIWTSINLLLNEFLLVTAVPDNDGDALEESLTTVCKSKKCMQKDTFLRVSFAH